MQSKFQVYRSLDSDLYQRYKLIGGLVGSPQIFCFAQLTVSMCVSMYM